MSINVSDIGKAVVADRNENIKNEDFNTELENLKKSSVSTTLPEVVGSDVRSQTPFYYDQVLFGTLTSVSLHANSIFVDGKWIDAYPTYLTDDEGYMEEYLIKAPLLEDYNVGMNNTWTEFGDDAIGGFFNSLKPFAPYLGHLAQAVKTMNDTEDRMKVFNDPDANTNFYNFVDSVTNHIADTATKGSEVLNRSLVSQGARFSYYSGTGTSFGNLSMKFTVFSGWYVGYDGSGTSWKSVNDQLKPLYPYLIGKYTKGVLDENDGTIQGTDINTGIKGENAQMINEFLSWQLPPAGYKPDTKDLDNVMFGTLKLKFGAFYSLSSLVCTNAQFNFSKQMVKHWDGKKNILSPLYCDVVINFQPATKYSDDSMKRFVSGFTMQTERATVKNGLKKKLDQERDSISKYIKGQQ